MSFYILSSWLTVLSGDFSPGLQHHPFLSIQHPQYKFCDLHSILSHWEVQFQSIHMLPRIPHQESKTSLNFSLIHPWQLSLNFFFFLINKWLHLHLNICLCVQKKCGADNEWICGPPEFWSFLLVQNVTWVSGFCLHCNNSKPWWVLPAF